MRTAAGRASVAAARAGAAVIERAHAARGTKKFTVDRKGPIDLVTSVDREAEAAVVARLGELMPEVPILAEESGFLGGSRSGRRFLVDPIDGTTNFAHGFPIFCVSIGYEEEGRVVAGAILDPTRDELFTAEAGAGAHLNGEPLRVSEIASVGSTLLGTGFPYSREAMEPALARFARVMRNVRAVRRAGSAALDLCAVAAGRLDGYWAETLREWDTAAGELLVREAGGRVTGFDGAPFENGGPNLAASNGAFHDAFLDLLREPH